jgi:hypothetical protein
MQAQEQRVQGRDLRPVRLFRPCRLRVKGGDCRLQRVESRASAAQRALREPLSLGDLAAIPERAVLLLEGHDLALRVEARGAPRVVQEHEGEEAVHLARVGKQLAQEPSQPDRLAAQIAPHEGVSRGGGVALVEDEIDDAQDPGQALGQAVDARHLVGDAGGADLSFRAHQPLGHRDRRDEERARDLLHGKAAECLQRQRHLGFEGERGVTAGEDEAHDVVGEGLLGEIVRGNRRLAEGGDLRPLRREGLLAPQPVDRLVAPRGDQPRERVPGDARLRPLLQGRRECLLQRILGEIEVAEEPDQGRERARTLLAVEGLEFHDAVRQSKPPDGVGCWRRYSGGGVGRIGRTSIEPVRAPGMPAASVMASSRSFASTM